MSGIEKFLNVLGFQVEWDEADQKDSQATGDEKISQKQPKRAELKSQNESAKVLGTAQVVLIEPEKISDAKEICNELRNGKTVVINVERLDKTDVIRVCDFISGATYALSGKMKEISENVLVIAPSNVDIQTSETDSKPSYEDDEYEY